MTDEQFKQLMDKLEELKRAQEAAGRPYYPPPQPWQPQWGDQNPWHWPHGGARD